MAGVATPPPGAATLSSDALYWRAEAQKAIREREEVKRSLLAEDGAAAFWRTQAKDATKKLGDALKRNDALRKAEQDQREHAIGFSEQVDELKRQALTTKQQLWAIWGALDDTNPVKQQLWAIWAAL